MGRADRHALRDKVQMRRIPSLRFERDESIERGLKIEQLLAKIKTDDADRGSGGQGGAA